MSKIFLLQEDGSLVKSNVENINTNEYYIILADFKNHYEKHYSSSDDKDNIYLIELNSFSDKKAIRKGLNIYNTLFKDKYDFKGVFYLEELDKRHGRIEAFELKYKQWYNLTNKGLTDI